MNIFSSPYIIASKLEAFKGRGNGDGRTSQDFEDIVFVLDNRKNIWNEMQHLEADVRTYLTKEWIELLNHPYHEEWISAHLEYGTASARTRYIIASLRSLIDK